MQLSEIMKEILADKSACLEIKDLAITGNDIIQLGVKQGAELGEILKFILNDVIEENIPNDREYLLNYVRNKILDRQQY